MTANEATQSSLNDVATHPIPGCTIDKLVTRQFQQLFIVLCALGLLAQAQTPLTIGIKALHDFTVKPNGIGDVLTSHLHKEEVEIEPELAAGRGISNGHPSPIQKSGISTCQVETAQR